MTARRRSPPPAPAGRPLEADVYEALVAMGWAPPQCEGDVAAAETGPGATGIELPAGLADAKAALEGVRRERPGAARGLELPRNGDIDAALARAAREGGAIPPEVERAMRRDRRAAEEERDHDPPGRKT